MNLLPKSREEFSEKDYWESFFKKRGSKAFEWYGEYPQLSGHLHKYVKPQDDILISGCGNSSLGRDLYDIGFSKITNIDISNVVIRQMLAQNKERPNLKFIQMDALETSFSDDSFGAIIDKGTLDALMPDEAPETVVRITKYFKEIQRILRATGRYICISLLQEHILKILLDFFPKNNFMFRVVRCLEAENGDNSLPVFMIVCTKFKNLPRKILEINFGNADKMQRFEEVCDVISEVKGIQQAAFICTNIKRSKIEENEVSIDLYKVGNTDARFTVHIVDAKFEARNAQYAAFIVPQGREAEWLFSTKSGRQHLTKMTKMNRLAIVTMHRNHTFGTFDQVQKELDEAICNFAPTNLKKQKIPYLSLGSDVGNRTIIHKGRSVFSGDYVIEDVMIDGEKFRRLFFLNSQLVIQSEARLKKDVIDLSFLTCKHHVYMTLATMVACQKSGEFCVVGLGGGGLCSFLHKFRPQNRITAVEIDPEMLNVATEWFGLTTNENLKIVIQDGVDFLDKMAAEKKKFDAILFDVDSKDTTIGLSCPPQQFLQENVLDNVCKLGGFFILNLVLRQANLRDGILDSLHKKFQTVISYKLAEELNEILVCTNSNTMNIETVQKSWRDSSTILNKFFKKSKSSENEIDINELINNLKVL